MAAGYWSPYTETVSLGDPNIQCPDLPDFPGDAEYPAGFLNGDIPVLCGGNLYDLDSSCYELVYDGQAWNWEVFNEMNEPRYGPGYAQMGQDWFLAGIYI